MKRNRKNVTIQDVSRAAGVSVSTVSRVLNQKDDVSEETVEKVQKVIRELGFVSSLAARSMRSHRTDVIGMVIPDVASYYCAEIMGGVNQVIAQIGSDLIIYTNGGSRREHAAELERSFVALLNGGISDGVIVVTPTAPDFISHAPVVVIDPNHEDPGLPAVISTNHEGSLEIMNYLTGLGHRRIAHITGRMELVSTNQRLQGYKDGLAAAGIPFDPELVEIGDYRSEKAEKCARNLLALKDPPTAIFAANDMSAMGVYRAAQAAGLRIPQDLSVVGFDNIRDSAYMDPPLTTVDQFLAKMGTIATEMIVKLINGEDLPSQVHVIQTQLVIRASCETYR